MLEFLTEYVQIVMLVLVILGTFIAIWVTQVIRKNALDENDPEEDMGYLPPEKTIAEKYLSKSLLIVIVLVVISGLMNLVQARFEDVAIARLPEIELILLLVSGASSVFLGFFLNSWWESANSQDQKRQEAIAITKKVDEFLLNAQKEMEQVAGTLMNLAPDKMSKKTFPFIKHFIDKQERDIRHFVRQAANDISNLWPPNDYRSARVVRSFMAQREEKITAILESTVELVGDMQTSAVEAAGSGINPMDIENNQPRLTGENGSSERDKETEG